MTRSTIWMTLAALGLVATASMCVLTQARVPPVPPNPGAPPGLGLVPSFAETFDGTTLDTDRWRTSYFGQRGVTAPVNQRTLPTNGERQLYFDPGFLNLGVQPFTVGNGVLTITARRMSPGVLAATRQAVATLPADQRNGPIARTLYQSGMITTHGTFSQTYGYFEMRARLPAGKGLWPAFWMLPEDNSWPPEIDIMEMLGDKPATVYMTVHSRVQPKSGKPIEVAGPPGAFHRYGALWLPDRIDYYLDGVKTFTTATPADAHKPMHLLANLAVGGYWPGDPDAGTVLPARMEIDSIRAWRLPVR